MILLNGKGLLGEQLKKDINTTELKDSSVHIYHTWNVVDKSENTQKKEYIKYKNYLDDFRCGKIFFISSVVEKPTWYTYYKHLAEADTILKNFGFVIRIPQIAADSDYRKGTFYKLKRQEIQPYGEMFLTTLEQASSNILKIIIKCKQSNLCRFFTTEGSWVNANLATELMRIP